MVKTEITIVEATFKESAKGKKYLSIKTNNGESMSCFEKEISDKLVDHMHKPILINMELSADGNFKNIRGFMGLPNNQQTIGKTEDMQAGEERAQASKPVVNKPDDRNVSFKCGYCARVLEALIMERRKPSKAGENVDTTKELTDLAIRMTKRMWDGLK